MAGTTRPRALPTFEVSKEGLAAQLARRPKAFIVAELAQNAWDEDSSQVDITVESLGKGKYRLVVEDDNPEGFKDLSHAYTLFADSLKKDDPEKRGRFNLGEKLVIAMCDETKITTTKGTVLFTSKGRYHLPKKRAVGSSFEAVLRMTKAEFEEIDSFVNTLIVPENITTTYNLRELGKRKPVAEFTVPLRTEIADSEGRLRPTVRKTVVRVFDPREGETASIYELGIPVVETGDRFHVEVMQKVPLNSDRDNVPPAYLRDVRVQVLNHTIKLLSETDAKATWVSNALEDEDADPEAVKLAFSKRFGEKAVIHDPNDLEANKIAVAAGYTVVPGGALPKAAWKNVKGAGAVLPAGQVTPSPNPSAGDEQLKIMDPDHYTQPIENVVAFAREFGEALLERPVQVRVATDVKWPFNAAYGPGRLTLNLGRLGHSWFAEVDEDVIDLLVHEFGHEWETDHLSRGYYKALTMLAGRTWRLALDRPELFEKYGVVRTIAA